MRNTSLNYLKIECLMGFYPPVPISYGLNVGDLDKLKSILTTKSDINQNHSFKFFIMVEDKKDWQIRRPIRITEEDAREFLSGRKMSNLK